MDILWYQETRLSIIRGDCSRDFNYEYGRKQKNDSSITFHDKIATVNKKLVGSLGYGISSGGEMCFYIRNVSSDSVTISNLSITF